MKRKYFLISSAVMLAGTIVSSLRTYAFNRTIVGFKVENNKAKENQSYTMKGVTQNKLDVKISSEDTNGELAVFEQTGLSPNGGPPLHIHPTQDEWFYVLEGNYSFKVGDQEFEMKEGETIFLPRGVPHAFIQRTEKGRMIVSYLPAGKMREFFEVTSRWESPLSKEEIANVFEEHGMKVVGPPLR